MTIDDDDDISGSSLATPRPLEDGAATVPQRETFAEQMYIEQGRSLKALALLSLGLKNDDDTPTFDLAVLPWSAAKPKTLKMGAKELRDEVMRRNVTAENVLHAPRPAQWPVKKATDWLVSNPIVAEDEVAFIRATISHRISVADRAALQAPDGSNSGGRGNASGGGNWVGKNPHLRLIHTIIDNDNIKAAYKARLHVPSGRMAVENRRTAAAIAQNVWVLVAAKWNDKEYHPITSVKDCHSDFSNPIAIPFELISHLQPATPEKVEEKWNSMNLALKRGIQNWERSGQGDGGHTNDEDEDDGSANSDDDESLGDDGDDREFGSLKGRGRTALDLRRNFFDDRATYLLYLWDILDEHDLVKSTMQQLLDGVGAGNGRNGVPSVINNKRNNEDDYSMASSKKSNNKSVVETAFLELKEAVKEHSNSLVSAAKIAASEQAKNRNQLLESAKIAATQKNRSELNARINSLRDMKRDMALRMTSPNLINHQVAIDAIIHEMEGIDAEIASKTEELNSLLATPTRSNRSPPT